jgi:uncharacterized membrane protein YeaQ/YmgE (transglycosylase-associated protein family)
MADRYMNNPILNCCISAIVFGWIGAICGSYFFQQDIAALIGISSLIIGGILGFYKNK